ncbi:MAG TPA: type IV secretion protein Rhs [Cyanobacteria bacterium UBA11370]|nr:type IV secretion protein Rhs [Cyanobacteria bacterium UBA11370]
MISFCDAFISYGRADSKAFATKLHRGLIEAGFKVWFDQNDIPLGVDFQNQIDEGIEKADNFLFIIAPHSVNSPYCLKEIELAIKRKKRIIPLLHVEQITQETWQQRFPNRTVQDWEDYKNKGLHTSFQNMHPAIGKINWVYFREGIEDFDKSLTDLINLIQSHSDYVEQHTQFLIKALDWERHQKQTRYLLIGEEKQQAEYWLKRRFKEEQPPCIPTDLHCELITESIKNANNLMSQVFVSYADEDRETMEKICNSLRRESITVWTNRSDIQMGEAFEEAIRRGIEQADNVVYLRSPDSVKSEYCQQELDYALSLNKRIIPVLVRETPLEEELAALRSLQYIDLTDNVKEEDYYLDESQLLRILHQDEAYYNEHKILLTKALKWQRQQYNPSILLRGYNLRSAEAWLKVAGARSSQHLPTALMAEFINESLRQPPASSLEVFISYSRSDSDFARRLNEALQIQGKTTWFDQESIASGTDFQAEIYRGIKACDNFLFIVSPRSVNSPYCADEVEYAASLNKRFVTVLHQEVKSVDLHPELAKVQWIDFNQNQRDFNANFSQLVRTLDTDRDHVHSHTKWLQRAIEWNEHDQSDDLLLRGSELAIAETWLLEAEQKNKQPQATELQQALITASQEFREHLRRQDEERQQRELEAAQKIAQESAARVKQERRTRLVLGISVVVLSGSTLFAFSQAREAQKNAREAAQQSIIALAHTSNAFFLANRQLDSMITALQAGKKLKDAKLEHDAVQSQTAIEARQQTNYALQQAIYNVQERNRLEGHKSAVYSVSFSPDGKTLASASGDKTIKLWDVATGKQITTLKGHTNSVSSVSFSPDGKTLAFASGDKTIKLWDVATGKQITALTGHEELVTSVSFSPDDKTLASGSYDQTIKLWDVATGKEITTLKGHSHWVNSVSFSPDGKRIASASGDNTIKLWDVATGKEITTLKGHEESVNSVSFSPDGKRIAWASGDNTIKLWDVATGQEITTLKGHSHWVKSVSFSPDGKTIASASWDKTIKLWDVATGQEITTLKGHEDWVNSVSFSPDGKTIASASTDDTIKLWDVTTGQEITTLTGHEDWVGSVSFSPDGKMIASASGDKTIKLWDVATGKELTNLKGHSDWVNSVSFSTDGKRIASASGDKTIKLWDVATGQEITTLKGHEESVNSVSFSPDGKTLASASGDQTIKLWDVATGQEITTITGHEESVTSVSFSPDGKRIASASGDQTIKLWDVATGQEITTITGHSSPVTSVSFSPDGKMIASGSYDKTIKLWDVATGQEITTLTGHSSLVTSVSFSPDGKTIASASGDTTIKLWDVATGKAITTLTGHSDRVSSVSFSPDGKTIASGSSDKTIKLWMVYPNDFNDLMRLGCDRVRGYLKYNAPESDRTVCDGISQ